MIEVFNEISKHMIKGIMFHEQMADYFDFLDLHGLKRWQEYRFFEESAELRGIHRYALNHCNRIINDGEVSTTRYIPNSWYNYTRFDVDNGTRKTSVKDAFEKWLNWEKETKTLYEKLFKKLTENSYIADASKVNQLIQGVDAELKHLTRKMIEYKAVDYDMSYIMCEQDEMHNMYENKLKENFKIEMC